MTQQDDTVTDATLGATGRLVRASAVVGVGTALSRVTGLLRVAAVTYALGAVSVADAYNLANNTPNIIYELILGGILSATLVPVFVDRFDADDEDGISAVVTVAVVGLVVLTVVAVLVAPAIFALYTVRKSGAQAHELASVGVPLTRMFVLQIAFYGLTALGTALLNSRRRFAAPAFAPVLNNLVVCGVLVAFARAAGRAPSISAVHSHTAHLLLLGFGTTAGIVAMTVVLWWPLRRAGVHLHWRFRPRDPSVRKVASLSGWTVGYVITNQIALAVVLALAARRTGDASAYTYAFVFFQLPHGLIAVSLMTTFVPELASHAARDDMVSFRSRFGLGLRLLVLLIAPAAAGYALLARPLVIGLLAHGALTRSAAELVAEVLVAFSLGLLGFSLYLFTLRGFYALKDTKTPFVLNGIENGVNIVIALIVVGRFNVQGLALAYSAAYTVAAVVALATLRKRIGGVEGRRLVAGLLRVALATGVMAAVVAVVTHAIGSNAGVGAVERALAGVVAGAVTYAAVLLALRTPEVTALRDQLLRRRVPA
jgi:putative peptidoglycan lipid II flippase